ncbi:MAG: MCE family protein [Deltaproteobacteria bacterium]|nr:MCE family protein [Deltaproteobacteria bacterium]
MSEIRKTKPTLSPEAKVGIFVLAGILVLVYMSLRVGGMRFGRAEGYTLHVVFDSAAGLDKDAAVRVAGVEVGRVSEIRLIDDRAHLTLQMHPDVKIGRDFVAVLTTKGLLGERYMELIPGAQGAPPLKDGEAITHVTSYADMDKLITVLSDVATDIKTVSESFSKALGGKEGEEGLKNIVKNIEEISARLNNLIAKNDGRFSDTLKNLDEFSAVLKKDGPRITEEMRAAAQNLNDSITRTSNNLNGLIDDNRGNLKETVENLKAAAAAMQQVMASVDKIVKEAGPGIKETVASANSVAKKLDKGEGTLGKLINDTSIHDNLNKTITGINGYLEKAENFHTFLGYRAEYLFKSWSTKSYFSLKLQPKADKYYLIEIVSDPKGKSKKETRDITTGATTTSTTEVTTTDSFKFTIQIAKRFKDAVVRGGIIESTGGGGLDYYLFRDNVKLSFELFDFARKGRAHAKAGAHINLNRYFFLAAGLDDFADKTRRSSYLGVGLQFEDEDVKYILSGAGSAIGNL